MKIVLMTSERSTLPVPERYGSKEMREVFEEESYLNYQLMVEAAVAEAQAEIGLIPKSAAIEISSKANLEYITIERWREIESITQHETASLVEAVVEVCGDEAKPWVHYGLTSNDVLDTSLSLQLKRSMEIMEGKIISFTEILCGKALEYQDLPAVGRTHGQHTSIISFGLKFAVWASEMNRHILRLRQLRERALVCKTLGVVGTGSVMGEKALKVQALTAKKLGLKPLDAATQVIPRDILAEVIFFTALVVSSLDKMATEVRNLQRTEIREVAEPFRATQIGSSAVPMKRNPIKCERVSSLAKLIRALPSVALQNIPLWHERDLSNSANERIIVPSAFILLDECINSMTKVMGGLVVRADKIRLNIDLTQGQIYSEFILDILLKKGISRSHAHRLLNNAAGRALKENISYSETILRDEELSSLLTKEEVRGLFDPIKHFSASKKIIAKVADLFQRTKES
ncbi:MAG: adenylosuccinate lyase [Candidatus Methylarchaceae archaeon HK01M]|nr:adenylosuccinate lyase [Candidatus Methylarchaceae archaeon HK01M]